MVSASLSAATPNLRTLSLPPDALGWPGKLAPGQRGELGLLAPMRERQIALGHEEPLGEPVGGDEESRAPADD